MKLLSVVGARPQFIKIAPMFFYDFKKHGIIHRVVHTGQHYDFRMDGIFFQELNLPQVDYHLGVGSGSNVYQVCEIAKRLEEVFIKEKPDWVLVYGDTNSTLGGALCAVKLGFKVAHVEAGLRSYNKSMQEEINRVMVDHISDVLFCPTRNSKTNLFKEGIKKNVFIVGDLMLELINILESKIDSFKFSLSGRNDYILLTLHRAENVDNPAILGKILAVIKEISEKICKVIFPVHPRTMKRINDYGLNFLLEGVEVIEPVSFLEMLKLQKDARVIMTDSGGIQKEAMYFSVPCVTLRNETEWTETIKCGANTLISPFVNEFRENLIQKVNLLIGRGKNNLNGLCLKYLRYRLVAKKIYDTLIFL
ncbi:MAG: non-hydrolyzing UDP-N-acetylglucosamine 2-epimerase [bacterium]